MKMHFKIPGIISAIVLLLVFSQCKKHVQNDICPPGAIVFAPPSYSTPLWYIDGQRLCFNWIPLAAVDSTVTNCGTYFNYTFHTDSTGFYIINRDGSQLRRLTNFTLLNPAWSPDGKWIAFSNNGAIVKMAFDGNNFDTTHIITLAQKDSTVNSSPSWSPAGDSIYYERKGTSATLANYFSIWKMAQDGSGQSYLLTNALDAEPQPFCMAGDSVIFGKNDGQLYIADAGGNTIRQLTNNEDASYKDNPRYFNNKFFYEDDGIWYVNADGAGAQKIANTSLLGFSIATDGTIAYVYFNMIRLDRTFGTIWLMNADGSNNRQFTHNNY